MKKAIAIFVTVAIVVALCSCGQTTTIMATPSLPERNMIPESEITNYLKVDEISLDNWEEFYVINEHTDKNGEINWQLDCLIPNSFAQDVRIEFQYTSTETRGMPDKNGKIIDEVRESKEKSVTIIRDTFNITSTLVAHIYQLWGDYGYSKYEISNFSCVSAGGKFITHSIPEEYWYTDDSGRRCFDIDLGDNSFWTVYDSEMEWLEKYI